VKFRSLEAFRNAEAPTLLIRSRVAIGYLFALTVMSATVSLRLLLNPLLGTRIPYMAAFLGLAVTARYAGFGPSIFALVFGGALAAYFFLPPALASTTLSELTGLMLYFAVGGIIILLTQSQRHAQKVAEERQTQFADEAQKHRETAEQLQLQRDRLIAAEEALHDSQRLLHVQVIELQTEVTNRTLTEHQLREERNRLAIAESELQRTKNDLLERLRELQRFEEAVVGRELKMIEMEKELRRLRKES
jgi:K+-sensing histidine kinase KdpD